MMEVLQTIFMVIGAVTFIWLLVKLAKGCFWLLGGLLEAGFRNRFPDDFMMHFGWIISEMETRGYVQSDMMDAGSEYPGILMKNEETGGEMEIRLHAPLFSEMGYSIIVSNHINHTAIVMQDSPSDDNKRLLSKYLE
jgi:hypothetical protein